MSEVYARLLNAGWFRLILIAAATAPLLGGCGMFGGEEVEEDTPAELIDFKPALKIKKVWSAKIGDSSEFQRLALTPASDGSRVFAAAVDGKVAAFDAVTGKKIWRVKTKLALSAGPSVNGHIVVLGSSDGDLIALNARDGQELWRITVSSEVLAPPALTDTDVFVTTVDGKLSAFNLLDGEESWVVVQSVPRLSVRGTGSPVVVRNKVVCGFDNGKVAAYQADNGAMLWEVLLHPPSGRTEVDRLADINSTVSIVGSDLYAVGYQGRLAALALESGQILWARDVSSYSGVSADTSNVYVAGAQGEVIALSRGAGREVWRREILRFRDITRPTPFGRSVVVGDFEGYLHWFSAANGVLQARKRAGSDRISSAPLVVNDMLYVLTDGGKLFAFKEVTRKRGG